MGNSVSLVNYAQEQLGSYLFLCEFRSNAQCFVRESVLSFKNVGLIILGMVKKSIKAEVMRYFYRLDEEVLSPSRQAFSEAREKISYLAFVDFFKKSCELALCDPDVVLHNEYRLFAVDGTSFVAGKIEKLCGFFGTKTTVPGKAMCRISAVVDVMNDTIVNAVASPFSTGERTLALGQIEELKSVKNALFLFDRGYWSAALASKINQNGQKFLMRIQEQHQGSARKKGLRIHSFTLPGGNEEILVTNLSKNEMSNDDLVSLYTKRWGAETKYLELKARLQIDKLSSLSPNTALQDIYSTLYISNLVAFICAEADREIEEKNAKKNNKYAQKSNRTTCITALRDRFIDICLTDPAKTGKMLERLCKDIERDVTYVGKSKPRPRDKNAMRRYFKKSTKPIL
jgi:hypothetical protein